MSWSRTRESAQDFLGNRSLTGEARAGEVDTCRPATIEISNAEQDALYQASATVKGMRLLLCEGIETLAELEQAIQHAPGPLKEILIGFSVVTVQETVNLVKEYARRNSGRREYGLTTERRSWTL